MAIIMYERVGLEGRRPSPFSWRIRYALTHKGVPVEYRPVRFADVELIRQLSGQQFVPIIVDGEKVVHDSWRIAVHIDERFPDGPPLFGDAAARSTARFVNHWVDTVLAPVVRRLIYPDFAWCLAPEDRPYFRSSREKNSGPGAGSGRRGSGAMAGRARRGLRPARATARRAALHRRRGAALRRLRGVLRAAVGAARQPPRNPCARYGAGRVARENGRALRRSRRQISALSVAAGSVKQFGNPRPFGLWDDPRAPVMEGMLGRASAADDGPGVAVRSASRGRPPDQRSAPAGSGSGEHGRSGPIKRSQVDRAPNAPLPLPHPPEREPLRGSLCWRQRSVARASHLALC